MVLDSRSRVDSSEAINSDGATSSNNGSSAATVATVSPSISVPIAPALKKNPVGSWWQALGLRTKTTIVSVVGITIPLLVLGGFTVIYVGQDIATSTKQIEAASANGMAYRVGYFMRERYGDIQVLAQLSFLTNPKVQALLPISEQKAILENYLKSYLVYDSIAVYRLDGSLLIDASSEPPPANISKRPYFQTTVSTDKPFISQPEASVVTKKISVFIAAPVKDV
ncbi:MAG: PDC sensor domain-containing protein, partial [Pseudanabaena sp.]